MDEMNVAYIIKMFTYNNNKLIKIIQIFYFT